MKQLINDLQQKGVLHSAAIIHALKTVDRADFVPKELKHLAYEDTALPIGGGQTISQPYTVVFMLEQLQVQSGDVVLEIGYGSGWQTALLAHIVGPTGRVYAFEIVPDLCADGERNLEKYPHLLERVALFCRSAGEGYTEGGPFDRIIAAAEVRKVPQQWKTQLKVNGRMIYPRKQTLVLETKKPGDTFDVREFHGFVFVPFID